MLVYSCPFFVWCLWFCVCLKLALQNELRNILCSYILVGGGAGRDLWSNDGVSKHLEEFTTKVSWPWAFLCRSYIIIVIDIFRCSISSWVNFSSLCLFRSLSLRPIVIFRVYLGGPMCVGLSTNNRELWTSIVGRNGPRKWAHCHQQCLSLWAGRGLGVVLFQSSWVEAVYLVNRGTCSRCLRAVLSFGPFTSGEMLEEQSLRPGKVCVCGGEGGVGVSVSKVYEQGSCVFFLWWSFWSNQAPAYGGKGW